MYSISEMSLYASLLIAIHLSYALVDGQTCLDIYPEGTYLQGRNKMKNNEQPLFLLHFTENNQGEGWPTEESYQVHVSSVRKEIQKIKIVILHSQAICGVGQFTFDTNEFDQKNDPMCPLLLETKKRGPFATLPPLVWIPPPCGCVKFRVSVIDDLNFYYMEDRLVGNGPLSQTMCIEKRRNRQDYLAALCSASQSFNAISIINRPSFISRHRLDNTMNRPSLSHNLGLRRRQNLKCCIKDKPYYNEFCMDDVRRRRIAKVCSSGGKPEIPFVHFKVQHLRERQEQCCRYLGEHRFVCFGEKRDISEVTEASFLDFSMDDTDPANDVAIFASSRDDEALKMLRLTKFQKKTTIPDNIDKLISTSVQKDTRKELERLNEKIKCCQSGEKSGSSVTTLSTLKAIKQCLDEAGKYVQSLKFTSTSRKKGCDDCFATCCIERALSPKLSSCQKQTYAAACEYCAANQHSG